MSDAAPPVERARAAMRSSHVDAVVAASPGLVAFLTGHVLPAHLAYPSRDGRLEKPTIAVVTLEHAVTIGVAPDPEHGERVEYGHDRVGLADGPTRFRAVADAAASLGVRGHVAVELAWVPAAAVAALVERVSAADIRPLDDLLRPARAEKGADELAGIAEACALADAAHAAIRASVSPGVTELELYASAVGAMNARAGDLVVSGAEIQAGPRGALMMGPPTGAAVAAGDLVMSDVYPRHPNGWWADSCSTVCCGTPSPAQRRDWHAIRNALAAAQELLRPGVRAGEVYEEIRRCAGDQPGHAGHGIGRDHYEEPAILPDSDERLVEGAAIVVEPGCYGDGRGLRLEWAFEVTRDGGRPLTTFDLEL